MINQQVIPAISNFTDFKKFISLPLTYGILMNFQLAQLNDLVKIMKDNKKKVFIHSELIKGLSADEYGAIYLIQSLEVDGIISSKPKVIEICKKRGVIGVFRFFLKDSISLRQSLEMTEKLMPDYVEILPALSIEMIGEIRKHTNAKIWMGGLIKDKIQIQKCLSSGAVAITTSNSEFWTL
ncbi:MAG: glycerol-3-phosphate responsive antiterminator [Acholeplasmataceae bacterium]|nr:glycerol-3-phosphate responsive antiterminator [Acholeplasmataceae bacterium]